MQQSPNKLQIGIESSFGEDVVQMIDALDAYLNALYPDGPNYLLDVNSLKGEDVRFLVARVDGTAVGCGALVLHDLGYAEIKRMYVKPEARGLGIGAAILQELERLAKSESLKCTRLETGVDQTEALALYRRTGYIERGPFGDYPPDPVSVFMEKNL